MFIVAQHCWDNDEPSRAFPQCFFKTQQRIPTKLQAATYASTVHRLKAVDATKSDGALALYQAVKAVPVDFYEEPAHIRPDGRVVYGLGLYQAKTPRGSKQSWEYYKRLETISGETAFRKVTEGGCSLS